VVMIEHGQGVVIGDHGDTSDIVHRSLMSEPPSPTLFIFFSLMFKFLKNSTPVRDKDNILLGLSTVPGSGERGEEGGNRPSDLLGWLRGEAQ
jgi:hypothetical protein